MYLIRELLDLPLVEIGNLFGGRDHSTVIHSINKVEQDLQTDDAFPRTGGIRARRARRMSDRAEVRQEAGKPCGYSVDGQVSIHRPPSDCGNCAPR